jgi:hypothetical protein
MGTLADPGLTSPGAPHLSGEVPAGPPALLATTGPMLRPCPPLAALLAPLGTGALAVLPARLNADAPGRRASHCCTTPSRLVTPARALLVRDLDIEALGGPWQGRGGEHKSGFGSRAS